MLVKMVIAAALVALAAPAVRADDRVDHARQQVKAADIDYRLGRFAEALDGYTNAYELYPVPALLFNIAQCHKNLKDYAKAIFFFEGYLRDEPKAANRALVEDLIRESKEQLDRRPSGPSSEPASASAPVPAAPIAPAPAAPPGDPPSAGPVAPPDPERAPPRSRVLPGVLIGGGLAAAAAGGVFYYYGQKRGTDEKFVYDDTRALGGAMMAAGGVAVVAGAIWWLRRPAATGAPVAAITSNAAYAGWAGAF
jgi:tetratricopeptide (TPR) repeat protein